jgi:NADH dehydrogenase FAD-containing subunit
MFSDYIILALSILQTIPGFAAFIVRQRIQALLHHRTYKPLPDDQLKNVVVVGGSFGGFQAARRLTETLPTGYRVVFVEKNSHLNYVFAFPRFSVVKGHEQDAFIPYSGLSKGALEGIFHHVQDTATEVSERFVELKSGGKLEYAYLVIATGTSSSLPSKVDSAESRDAQAELRGMQGKIQDAGRIAIVGGGAVGVELASDIKDFYPEKEVTLVHSRPQLLNSFGPRLHEHVVKTLTDMGLTLRLNARPNISLQTNTLQFANGENEVYDLVVSNLCPITTKNWILTNM